MSFPGHHLMKEAATCPYVTWNWTFPEAASHSCQGIWCLNEETGLVPHPAGPRCVRVRAVLTGTSCSRVTTLWRRL